MPTYEYFCNDCKETSEIIHKIADIGKTHPCPKCSSENTEKRIGVTRVNVLGDIKIDNGFRDVLRNIHEKTPGSTLNTVIK